MRPAVGILPRKSIVQYKSYPLNSVLGNSFIHFHSTLTDRPPSMRLRRDKYDGLLFKCTFSSESKETNSNNEGFRHRIKKAFSMAGVENEDVSELVISAGKYSAYGAVGLTILGTVGIDTSPIIAGLGVTGAAIGFAARDLINNLLCGFTLIFFGRVRRGEKVLLAGRTGVVEKIELARVILRGDNGDTIIIPSAKIASDVIVIVKK
eukprot:CAMPEP_0185256712 /NCGR_PEP_ID=MMETSP1359-20130426/5795_1 /TAXON_ID=552665 /ORGANISM="Bigelowiella longifila, Strain CCMP242" /LENGTH=206 /DNA_ID=CAMNT_0027841423 /DNA_START=112 /DNA_END=732 /DNA_ORIENTATION=+